MKNNRDLLNELGLQSEDKIDSFIIDTDKIKRIVRDNLNSEPYERKNYMKKKIFSGAMVAVMVLAFASLSVCAAAFDWHEKLIKYFNPTQQQMEQLGDSVNTPLVSAESNGYTINVLQTINDKHEIYILYELVAPKGAVLTDDLQWEDDFFEFASEVDDERGAFGGSSNKVLEIKDNKMMVLRCEDLAGETINNQEVSLQLADLVKYNIKENDIEEEVVAKCSFDLKWKLTYSDNTKVFDVNKKVNLVKGINSTLETIEVSPMSVWVFIETDKATIAGKPVINFKDGSKIEMSPKNDFNHSCVWAAFWEREGGALTLAYRFDQITDISEIESITVGDLTVQIK